MTDTIRERLTALVDHWYSVASDDRTTVEEMGVLHRCAEELSRVILAAAPDPAPAAGVVTSNTLMAALGAEHLYLGASMTSARPMDDRIDRAAARLIPKYPGPLRGRGEPEPTL